MAHYKAPIAQIACALSALGTFNFSLQHPPRPAPALNNIKTISEPLLTCGLVQYEGDDGADDEGSVDVSEPL